MKTLNQTAQSREIEEKRQQMHAPKDQITLMEEKGKQIKQNRENIATLNPRLSEDRKKELEVPKDEMALIQEKQVKKDEAASMIKQGNQMKCGGKDCEVVPNKEMQRQEQPKNEQKLPPIKQQIGKQEKSARDLLDMDASPVRMQPKMEMRDSQEQFRKQMYSEHITDNNKEHELERKQQLTPKTADKIMNEIKNDEMKDDNAKKNHKKKAHHHQHQQIQNKIA